jgi:glutamate synthase (NADPH/NADH) small chain
MNASDYEQEVAQTAGVIIRHWLQPHRVVTQAGHVTGLELEYTAQNGSLKGTGEKITLPADQIFKAIGQSFDDNPLDGSGLELVDGRISVDEAHKTSRQGVWAGGDCIAGDEDLTVVAVEHGKLAAEDIHATLV